MSLKYFTGFTLSLHLFNYAWIQHMLRATGNGFTGFKQLQGVMVKLLQNTDMS